jgi:hypothetical protein
MVLNGRTYTAAGGYGVKVGTMADLTSGFAGTIGASTSGVIRVVAGATGFVPSGTIIAVADANAIPGNIRDGITVGGIAGNFTGGGGGSPTGSALPENVLAGDTFMSAASPSQQTGTMTDFSASTVTIDYGPSSAHAGYVDYIVPSSGFINQSDTYVAIEDPEFIQANIMATKVVHGMAGTGTADGTAVAADIASGKKAYVNGVGLIGTSTAINTSGATAVASDITSGKTAGVGGSIITGTKDLYPVKPADVNIGITAPSTQSATAMIWNFSVTIAANVIPLGFTLTSFSTSNASYVAWSGLTGSKIYGDACFVRNGSNFAGGSGNAGNVKNASNESCSWNVDNQSYDPATGILTFRYTVGAPSGLSFVGAGLQFVLRYNYMTI